MTLPRDRGGLNPPFFIDILKKRSNLKLALAAVRGVSILISNDC